MWGSPRINPVYFLAVVALLGFMLPLLTLGQDSGDTPPGEPGSPERWEWVKARMDARAKQRADAVAASSASTQPISYSITAHSDPVVATNAYQISMVTASGQMMSGQFVATELKARESRGYFLWYYPDGTQSLELVTGTFDGATDKLHLHSRQIQSRRRDLLFCDYEARLNSQARTITAGVRWACADQSVRIPWSGVFAPGLASSVHPNCAEWMKPPTERNQLMQELSDDFDLDGVHIQSQTDPSELEELTQSKDPSIAGLASLSISIKSIIDIVNQNMDFSQEARKAQLQILQFAIEGVIKDAERRQEQRENNEPEEGVGPLETLRDAEQIFAVPGGVIYDVAAKFRAAMKQGPRMQALSNLMRQQFKDYLRATSSVNLPSARVAVRLTMGDRIGERISPVSRGFLILTNDGEEPIHNVAIVLDVNIDRAAVNARWQQEQQQLGNAKLLGDLVGMDAGLTQNNAESDKLRFETLALGFGSMIYVDQWKPHSKIQIDVDSLGELYQAVDSIGISVASDEGALPSTSITSQSLRAAIKGVLNAQGQ